MTMGIEELMIELTQITAQLHLLEQCGKEIRQQLLVQMQDQNITDLDNGFIRVHLVKGFSKTYLDREKLNRLFPGAVTLCSRSSWVDDYLKVTSND